MGRPIVIHADWDPEAAVWVATTNDLKGLLTESDTIEALRTKLPGMIVDLLEEHGISDFPASIELIAHASDRLTAASASKTATTRRKASPGSKVHLRTWWEPVLKMKFDDPEQEAPFWLTTNNAVLRTPFRGIQIKAYASEKYSSIGVFVSGPKAANVAAIKKYLKRERGSLLKELPDGTKIEIDGGWPIILNGLILNLTKRSECGL